MEKFLSLSQEKQKTIIDAALVCFGTNGYKKASVSDIASAAGISKAMVFHYFGTKKALYFYLKDYCGNIVINDVSAKFDITVTDFFDRIMQATSIEMSLMKKHPAIMSFFKSMYYEADPEVRPGIEAILTNAGGEAFRNKLVFEGMDASKFKEGVDPKLVFKMLDWLTEGYLRKYPSNWELDLDALLGEFYECMNLLKNNFYKEEYL